MSAETVLLLALGWICLALALGLAFGRMFTEREAEDDLARELDTIDTLDLASRMTEGERDAWVAYLREQVIRRRRAQFRYADRQYRRLDQ